MTLHRNTSARTAVGQAIAPLFPKGERWQLIEDEGSVDDGDRVRVRCAVREFAHSDTGDPDQHLVTVRITITVPTHTLADAEPLLDDAMDPFLFALDAADVVWTTASKGRFEDENNRLGFQLDVVTRTTPTRED